MGKDGTFICTAIIDFLLMLLLYSPVCYFAFIRFRKHIKSVLSYCVFMLCALFVFSALLVAFYHLAMDAGDFFHKDTALTAIYVFILFSVWLHMILFMSMVGIIIRRGFRKKRV